MANKSGYVYLMRSGHFYKIGCTINVKRRMSEFSPVLLPFPLILEHSIECSDMYYAENYLHKQYAHRRMNGEWFKLNKKEACAICSILKLEPDNIYVKGDRVSDEPEYYLPVACENADVIDYLDSVGIGLL